MLICMKCYLSELAIKSKHSDLDKYYSILSFPYGSRAALCSNKSVIGNLSLLRDCSAHAMSSFVRMMNFPAPVPMPSADVQPLQQMETVVAASQGERTAPALSPARSSGNVVLGSLMGPFSTYLKSRGRRRVDATQGRPMT